MSRLFVKTKTKAKTSTSKTKTKTKTLGLKTKTKTKTLFFVLEAPRDQDFGLEDYITAKMAKITKKVILLLQQIAIMSMYMYS